MSAADRAAAFLWLAVAELDAVERTIPADRLEAESVADARDLSMCALEILGRRAGGSLPNPGTDAGDLRIAVLGARASFQKIHGCVTPIRGPAGPELREAFQRACPTFYWLLATAEEYLEEVEE